MLEEENDTLNVNVLHEDPRITTVENFITKEECQHMINLGKPKLERSVVSDDKGGYHSAGRTSSTSWILHDHDEITLRIAKKVAKYVNIPLENAEQFQIVHYDPKQEYRQHYDSVDHNGSEKTLRIIKYGGTRILTALVYLNDVEEGGSTKFTKLNKEVFPSVGKLLTFQDVCTGTNNKHPLSEHAGTPVIKGEKYIFNLWFRECSRKMLYSDFNPDYYKNLEDMQKVKTVSNNLIRLTNNKALFKCDNFISPIECKNMIDACIFSDAKYPSAWLKNSDYSLLINKLSTLINVKNEFFEGINIIKYPKNSKHGPFFDAYDINCENTKKHIKILGQRFKTITLSLTDNIEYKFDKLKSIIVCRTGTLIIYDNVNDTRQRDFDMTHTIVNTNNENDVYLLNIYIRELDRKGGYNNKYTHLKNDPSVNVKENIKLECNEVSNVKKENTEDYMETYRTVLKMFEDGTIKDKKWKSYKSFTFGQFNVLSFDYLKENVVKMKTLREQGKGLNTALLLKKYDFDEFHPANIANVLHDEMAELVKEYYDHSIKNKVFPLGDRQAQRFKSNNDPFSRFVHYEILPLIEHIAGRKLRPTYTYLSCYVTGSDLMPHTDREDCHYTVSFLISKDKDWAVYCDPVKQPVKGKGRYPEFVQTEEHVGIIGQPNGFIMFNGRDHIHWRNKYEGERYDILLLHYRFYED